jgi:ankyrin repeat protein
LRDKHVSTAEILARDTRVDFLTQDSFGRLPLHWACQCSSLPVVTACINGITTKNNTTTGNGSDGKSNGIDTATTSGDTSLHWAVSEGSLSYVTLLLKAGASPTVRNQRDETPLDLANNVPRHQADIIKLLQSHVPAAPAFIRAASDGGTTAE